MRGDRTVEWVQLMMRNASQLCSSQFMADVFTFAYLFIKVRRSCRNVVPMRR